MGIRYESLDEEVRTCMDQELSLDVSKSCLYISLRLTPTGAKQWPGMLREAILHHDDSWLAETLRTSGVLAAFEERHGQNGKVTTARIPITAADTLAEGEFNRFYIRGLCVQVLASSGTEVEVYRGKEVQSPRPESQAMIGKRLSAAKLLDDLRKPIGVDTAMGVPPGPNSGLTVRRVQRA
ncbi:MAG: hypothetical protein ACYDH4_08875 [Candidatus Cryosericum sp.]